MYLKKVKNILQSFKSIQIAIKKKKREKSSSGITGFWVAIVRHSGRVYPKTGDNLY